MRYWFAFLFTFGMGCLITSDLAGDMTLWPSAGIGAALGGLWFGATFRRFR